MSFADVWSRIGTMVAWQTRVQPALAVAADCASRFARELEKAEQQRDAAVAALQDVKALIQRQVQAIEADWTKSPLTDDWIAAVLAIDCALGETE